MTVRLIDQIHKWLALLSLLPIRRRSIAALTVSRHLPNSTIWG